jgi:hypothetical protein
VDEPDEESPPAGETAPAEGDPGHSPPTDPALAAAWSRYEAARSTYQEILARLPSEPALADRIALRCWTWWHSGDAVLRLDHGARYAHHVAGDRVRMPRCP